MLSQAVGLPNMSNLHRGLVASNWRGNRLFCYIFVMDKCGYGKGARKPTLGEYATNDRNGCKAHSTWDIFWALCREGCELEGELYAPTVLQSSRFKKNLGLMEYESKQEFFGSLLCLRSSY